MVTFIEVTSPSGAIIRWTFDGDYEAGTYWDGSPWVVDPGGGVGFVSISPFTQTPRIMSGTMLNPNTRPQGYDEAAYGGFAGTFWDPSLCVNLGLPASFSAGNSLLSTVSVPTGNSMPQVQFAEVLTIVASAPPANAFRPPYAPASAAAKAHQWTTDDLNIALLPSLFSWSALMDGSPHTIAQVQDNLGRLWIDHCIGYLNRWLAPAESQAGYGRDSAAEMGDALLALISDLDATTKRDIAARVVQRAIDNFYLLESGQRWPPDGGHATGRKCPILLAGRLLNHQPMVDIGVNYPSVFGGPNSGHFGEDGQTFVVAETSPGVYNYGEGGYLAGDVGTPEYGFRHSETPTQDFREWVDIAPNNYRGCCTGNVYVGHALTALAMDLRTVWAHDPFFDYTDRFMGQMPIDADTLITLPGWQRSWHDGHGAVWDAIRSSLGGGAGQPDDDPSVVVLIRRNFT